MPVKDDTRHWIAGSECLWGKRSCPEIQGIGFEKYGIIKSVFHFGWGARTISEEYASNFQ